MASDALSPALNHVAEVLQQLLPAVTLGIRVAVHQRKARYYPGVNQ